MSLETMQDTINSQASRITELEAEVRHWYSRSSNRQTQINNLTQEEN